MVENYALLSALSSLSAPPRSGRGGPRYERRRTRSAGTETAWFARDDPRPAYAMSRAWLVRAARGGAQMLLPRPRAGPAGAGRAPRSPLSPLPARRRAPDSAPDGTTSR